MVSKFSEDEIWNILKNIKLSLAFDIRCSGTSYDGPIYFDLSTMKPVIEMVESQLQIEYPNKVVFVEETGVINIDQYYIPKIFSNMTDSKLNTAAKMYFYTLSCPGTLMPWFKFYSDLFQNKPPNQIVLTLNRILKGEKTAENKSLKNIAEKLFNVIATNSSFKYKDIKRMIQRDENSSSTNVEELFKLEGKLLKLHDKKY